jgi:hypothetical protein
VTAGPTGSEPAMGGITELMENSAAQCACQRLPGLARGMP